MVDVPLNPYQSTHWDTVIRIPSATHMHLTSQEEMDDGYRYGLRHFPISNYYPSAPFQADTRLSDFKLRQTWPTKRDGASIDPPIHWNKMITWQDELEESSRSSLPFVESALVFPQVPKDVILSHNAEHHGFTNADCHICSPGSSFASGTFDVHGRYRLDKHGFAVGFGDTWQKGFAGMIDALDYPNGGGITICHPTWFSKLPDSLVFEMLDLDERVLGIEIYNDFSANRDWFADSDYEAPAESEPGFSLNLWDRILATGRRCWGFCVPDHSVGKGRNWNGRNVLLASRFTEEECLRAYRDGSFYGCLKDNGLTVTHLRATETEISVETNGAAEITFITNEGIAKTVTGTTGSYEIPMKNGNPKVIYTRIEVADESGERLFLQPVMHNH